MAADIAILLVEDNADHRELTLAALYDCCEPARIATAVDGNEALDFMFGRNAYHGRDARKQPRLVILDIRLPGLDGISVLRAMRDDPLTQSVPVVMLSGSSDKAELDRCYQFGANSVMRKTLEHDELRRKMRHVYDFWITVNEADRNSRV